MKIQFLFSAFPNFLQVHSSSLPLLLYSFSTMTGRLEKTMTVMVCCHLCLSDYVEHDQQRAVVNAKNVASLFPGGHLVLRRSLPSLFGLWSCSQTAPKVPSSSSSSSSYLASTSSSLYNIEAHFKLVGLFF